MLVWILFSILKTIKCLGMKNKTFHLIWSVWFTHVNEFENSVHIDDWNLFSGEI